MSLRPLRNLIQRMLRGDHRIDAVSEQDQRAIAPYFLEANVAQALCWGVPLSALEAHVYKLSEGARASRCRRDLEQVRRPPPQR
jgi:hypothetical protein